MSSSWFGCFVFCLKDGYTVGLGVVLDEFAVVGGGAHATCEEVDFVVMRVAGMSPALQGFVVFDECFPAKVLRLVVEERGE